MLSEAISEIYAQDFPELLSSDWALTSSESVQYNCIAWAVDDTSRWWWPDAANYGYWPDGIPRANSTHAFVEAFKTLGFKRCNDSELERGILKIAIFTDGNGVPTHVARQLEDGYWSSKLGKLHDIRHRLNAIEGPKYGTAAIFMKRSKKLMARR